MPGSASKTRSILIVCPGIVVFPSIFRTGDTAFYGDNSQKLFHDQCRRAALTSAEIAAIENNRDVKDLLQSLGFALTEEVMEAIQKEIG